MPRPPLLVFLVLAPALGCASGPAPSAGGPAGRGAASEGAERTGTSPAPIRLVTELAGRSPEVRAFVTSEADAIRRSPRTERAAKWIEWHAPGTALADCLIVHGPGTRGGGGRLRDPLELGLRDPETQRWVDALQEGLDAFEAWLPTPRGWLPTRPKLDRLEVADLVIRGGPLAGSAAPGTHLRPAVGAAGEGEGRHDVIWRNLTDAGWFERSVRPFAERLLVPHQRRLVTARAHLCFYATRFLGYQLGPQEALVAGVRHPVRDWFGADWGPLQIAKADVLGVLAHEWLAERGVVPLRTSDENVATWVVMAFYTLTEERSAAAPAAHGPACALALSFLRDHEALERLPDGTWEIDLPRARAAQRDLVATIFGLFASGDRAAAAALLVDRGTPNAEIEATVLALGPVPSWRAPVEYAVR